MIVQPPSGTYLGYELLPARRPSEPGYAQLVAVFADVPSEAHFDPQVACLTVVSEDRPTPLVVEHPWNGQLTYRFCAGQVDLIDRRGKHLDVFTFGGELNIQPSEHQTTLTLHSAAPILVPFSVHTIPALLAEEAEIVLAQRRAARQDCPDMLDQHLSSADPLGLYFACLEAIAARFQNIPQHDDLIVQFRHTLKVEIQAIERELPIILRRLDLDEML